MEIGKKLSRKQKTGLLAAIVLPSVILGVLLFLSYAINKSKDIVLSKYAALKTETDGDKAAAIRDSMTTFLATNRLGLDALHLEQGELDRRVEAVYYRQASRALASLGALKGDPESAEKLRKEFFHCRKLAGPEQKMEADEYVHRLVAVNYLGKAALQGVNLDVADLKKAGIIVNAVYHGKPVKNRESINKAILNFNERHKNR